MVDRETKGADPIEFVQYYKLWAFITLVSVGRPKRSPVGQAPSGGRRKFSKRRLVTGDPEKSGEKLLCIDKQQARKICILKDVTWTWFSFSRKKKQNNNKNNLEIVQHLFSSFFFSRFFVKGVVSRLPLD